MEKKLNSSDYYDQQTKGWGDKAIKTLLSKLKLFNSGRNIDPSIGNFNKQATSSVDRKRLSKVISIIMGDYNSSRNEMKLNQIRSPPSPTPQTQLRSFDSDENNNNHSYHQHYQIKHQQQHIYSSNFRVFTSELIGTFIFVYLGQSTLTSFELIGTQNDVINRQLATILTFGLAFLLATLLTINLSGAHLNPAYTIACASYKYLKWSYVLNYVIAQYLGSFMAAIFLHATFSDKLAQRHLEGLLNGFNSSMKAHGNILSTGKLFSSYPPTEVSLTQLFISYTLANMIFMLILLSIHESKLIKINRCIKPIYLALTLVLVQAAFSANGGPVLNPAQDFSPRLYISLFGWGLSAFNLYHYDYWWLCGIVAPHFGALIGFGLYQLLAHINQTTTQHKTYINDEL